MLLPQLPYPPTVNTYYRHVGAKVLISAKGREYRNTVMNTLQFRGIKTLSGPVKLVIEFHAPDNRRRDLDNLTKCLLDSLKFGGIYLDDSQVRHIDIKFGEVRKSGATLVTVVDLSILEPGDPGEELERLRRRVKELEAELATLR